MKDVILQLRYPYVAGIIAVMWLGSALVAILKPDMSLELLIGAVAFASIIVALMGFSAPKR
jgi:hypothetical protein